MAKLVFFAAVLVALVALSAAEGDNILQLPSAAEGQRQCQLQLQQSSLDACRRVVDQQLATQRPFFLSPQAITANWVQAQCCQQLRGISRECRAAAIRQIVSYYEHQTVAPLGGGWYPGVTYPQQGQGQGGWSWYLPGQTSQQQQGQGGWSWYLPGQTSQEQQGQGGWSWYLPSQTSQQKQGEGSLGESTTKQQKGSQDPSSVRNKLLGHVLRPAQDKPSKTGPQQVGQGQYCGTQSQTGFGGSSSPSHFGTDQQAAHLQVVARVQQIAAQLPAICQLEY